MDQDRALPPPIQCSVSVGCSYYLICTLPAPGHKMLLELPGMKPDPEGSREQKLRSNQGQEQRELGWDLQSPERGKRDKICIGFLTGQRLCASSGYRKQALLLLVSGRNGGAQWPGLWLSQHCRQGLKVCSGPAPSPALLHLPKPGMELELAQAPHYSTAGPARETRVLLVPKLAAKLKGCRGLGVPKPPVSQAPANGTTQQGPKGSAGFSGDTKDLGEQSGITASRGKRSSIPSFLPTHLCGIAVKAGEQRAPRDAGWGCE